MTIAFIDTASTIQAAFEFDGTSEEAQIQVQCLGNTCNGHNGQWVVLDNAEYQLIAELDY